jgi:hypothetical protein
MGKLDLLDDIEKIISTLQRIDSCLRNGQFVLAAREIGNLSTDMGSMGDDKLAEMSRHLNVQEVLQHLKRTGGFLQDIILAYGENNKTRDLVRRGRRAFLDSIRETGNAG